MSVYLPSVTWSGGVHTLAFGTPIDDPLSYSHIEQQRSRVPGTGAQDSWTDGVFSRARFAFRWVPASGTAADAGWQWPAPGVGAWRAHALQDKDTFAFRVDAASGGVHTCRLISFGEPTKESSGLHYRVDVEVEDVNGQPFTEF